MVKWSCPVELIVKVLPSYSLLLQIYKKWELDKQFCSEDLTI